MRQHDTHLSGLILFTSYHLSGRQVFPTTNDITPCMRSFLNSGDKTVQSLVNRDNFLMLNKCNDSVLAMLCLNKLNE